MSDNIEKGDVVEIISGEFKSHLGLVVDIADHNEQKDHYKIRLGTREICFYIDDIKKIIIQ